VKPGQADPLYGTVGNQGVRNLDSTNEKTATANLADGSRQTRRCPALTPLAIKFLPKLLVLGYAGVSQSGLGATNSSTVSRSRKMQDGLFGRR